MATSNQKTILFADDDPDDFYLFKSAMKKVIDEVEVVWASSGFDVLSCLQDKKSFKSNQLPNVIMLDLNMPGLDGKKILHKLKRDKAYLHIPVIIYTTSSSSLDIEECYRLGANSYVIKPGSLQEIVSTMNSVCRYWFETVQLCR